MRWLLFGKIGTVRGRFSVFVWMLMGKPEGLTATSSEVIDEPTADRPPEEAEPKRANFTSDFAVTGKPRAVPWHIRRKELEAAARTKRKRLESFQEYV